MNERRGLSPEDLEKLVEALRKPVPPEHRLTREETRVLAMEIAEEVLKRFSQRLGVDSEEGIRRFNVTLEWANERRELGQQIRRHGIMAAVVTIMGILGTGLVLWARQILVMKP